MNTQAASTITRWFTSRWHRGPRVFIAPTVAELPYNVPGDVRGLHVNGDVHLVAAQPLDSLAQTLAHEAVGHFGLRQMLGKEWPHFMRHLQDGVREGDPGFRSHRDHIRRSYVDEAGECYLTDRELADELAAFVAEDLVCIQSGTIRPARPVAQALEAVAGRVLREGLCLDRSVSRSELEGALLLASRHMEGWPWHPARKRICRTWRKWLTIAGVGKFDKYQPPMSLAESEALLRAEDSRVKQKDERAFLWSSLGLVLSILGLAACAGLLVLGIFRAFFGG